VISDGAILIDGTRIEAVGADLKIPDDAEFIDATGKVVMPGLIDAHSHIGLLGEPAVEGNVNHNEISNPITPEARGIDSFNPFDGAFRDALSGGVTAAWTQPGSANIIGGTGFVTKMWAARPEEMPIPDTEQVAISLGENPIIFHGQRVGRAPMTRMGSVMLLRKALTAARSYAESNGTGDMGMDTLARLVRREWVARIHALRADDILTAIRVAREFDLRFTIETAIDGYKVSEQIAEAGAPCVLGPFTAPRSKLEYADSTPRNAALLSAAGVKIAFQCAGASETQWLSIQAGIAVREGMPEQTALRSLTLSAAEILEVANRLGSLESGKDADIAIFSGNPLSTLSRCEMVLVNGQVVFRREPNLSSGSTPE
jgi:imidazolonepropionase-like amidohydrolase